MEVVHNAKYTSWHTDVMSTSDSIRGFFKRKPIPEGTKLDLDAARMVAGSEAFRVEQGAAMRDVVSGALSVSQHPKRDEILAFFIAQIPRMSLSEILFINTMILAAKRTRPEYEDAKVKDPRWGMLRVAKEVERVYQALTKPVSRQKYEFVKTGGRLSLLATPDGVIFKHTLPHAGAEAWESAAKYVAVAPIIKKGLLEPEQQEIYSRYSGFPFSAALHVLGSNFPEIADELSRQRFRIIATLNEHHIYHAHPHTSNFTVEFIKKDALRMYAESRGIPVRTEFDLSNPEIVNGIPFAIDNVLFDPSDYVRHRSEYIPVVRIIDFDLAKEMPEVSPDELRKMEVQGGQLEDNEAAELEKAADILRRTY